MPLFGPESKRIEAKINRQATRLENKQEKLAKKQANLNEFKKTKETTDKSLAGAKAKEAEEKKREEAAMVGTLLKEKIYAAAVDDLLNLDDDSSNEKGGLEKGKGKIMAIIEDRTQDSESLTNATPDQLKGLKGELEGRIKAIREDGDKKVSEAKNTNYTKTSKQLEREGVRDTRKQERKLVRLLRQIQDHIDNPGEKVA